MSITSDKSRKEFIIEECKALAIMQKNINDQYNVDLFQALVISADFSGRFNKLVEVMNEIPEEDKTFNLLTAQIADRFFITSKEHLGRDEFLDILRFRDINDLAITQESTRRTIPTCAHSKEDVIAVIKYFQAMQEDLPLEQARELLLNTIPTNIITSKWHKQPGTLTDFTNLKTIKPFNINYLYNAKLDTFSVTDIPVQLTIGKPEGAIQGAAAVYRKNTEGLDIEYINGIAAKGHFSILEHIPAYFKTKMTIGAFNQLVRHRHIDANIINEYGSPRYGINTLPIGTFVEVEVFTTLRGLMNISNERTCTHAQDEIRSLIYSIMKIMEHFDMYKEIVQEYFGPRCRAKQFNCLDPKSCENRKKNLTIITFLQGAMDGILYTADGQ